MRDASIVLFVCLVIGAIMGYGIITDRSTNLHGTVTSIGQAWHGVSPYDNHTPTDFTPLSVQFQERPAGILVVTCNAYQIGDSLTLHILRNLGFSGSTLENPKIGCLLVNGSDYT